MDFWIDTHAHLYASDFDSDRSAVMERCSAQRVDKIVMPNIDAASIDAMLRLEEEFPSQCFATMGLHPCSVKQDFQRELYVIENWLTSRSFRAVGEIGTDLYWDKTYWPQQQEAFRVQVGWAKQYRLPVIIHCRESLDQTIAIVEELHDENLTGVFHCFGGTAEQARRIMQMGFYLGIGGVVTFKKAGLDKVLPEVGLDHVILETDSPYLAPVPHRGKRNEPAFIPLVGERIAEIMERPVAEVRSITTGNAMKLFGLS